MNTENTLRKFVPTGKSRKWRNGLNAGTPVMTMPGAITSRGGYTYSFFKFILSYKLSFLPFKEPMDMAEGDLLPNGGRLEDKLSLLLGLRRKIMRTDQTNSIHFSRLLYCNKGNTLNCG